MIIVVITLVSYTRSASVAKLERLRKLINFIEKERQIKEIEEKEVVKQDRSFYLFNVDTNRIDLVISRSSKWPGNVKIGVKYWKKGASESEAVTALEPITYGDLSNQRISAGPLAGYKRGVVIGGLEPGTAYLVKEEVYKNVGGSYNLASDLCAVREFKTLDEDPEDRKLANRDGADVSDKDLLEAVLKLLEQSRT